MSAAPDPAELAPSRDLAAYGPRPRLGGGFLPWVILCVVSAVVGLAVGRWGLPAMPSGGPAQAPATQGAPAHPSPEPAAAPVAVAEPAAAPAAPVPADLAGRVGRLESQAGRADQAAVAALAAAALSDASQSSRPFDNALAPFRRLMPTSPDVAALEPLAVTGAPSRAVLAASLPPIASVAAAEAREPPREKGLLAHILAAVGRVVIIRRIDPRAPGVDGALARAEQQAGAGDLEGAVATLDGLPPGPRAPLASWMTEAEHRIEIDRHIAALRAQALEALAAPSGPAA